MFKAIAGAGILVALVIVVPFAILAEGSKLSDKEGLIFLAVLFISGQLAGINSKLEKRK